MRHTATELCEHERFHTLMNENPGASAMIWEKVDAELWDSRYDRLVEQYVQTYLEAYEGDEARIREELMADAYAGLNRFGEMPEVQRMVRELAQQFESGETADLLQGQVEPGIRSSQTAREQNRTRDGTNDLGDENTVFADGGESYSIANTRDMPWKDQVRGYFSNDGTIKSSDSLYLGESSVEGVDNAPMYIPTSVITKAIRPPKGSRSAHAMSQKNILNLQEGIKNAPVVIDNPARNSIVYVTADQDPAKNYIIAALDKNNDLYGETAHKVTSIHGRENIAAMLEKLGDDATIFVKNENKLNRMLPGNQILKSLALRAKVELVKASVAENTPSVKGQYSLTQAAEGRKMSSRARRDVNQTMNAVQTELRGLIEAETRAAWDVKEYLRTQGVALSEADQALTARRRRCSI